VSALGKHLERRLVDQRNRGRGGGRRLRFGVRLRRLLTRLGVGLCFGGISPRDVEAHDEGHFVAHPFRWTVGYERIARITGQARGFTRFGLRERIRDATCAYFS